MNRTDYIETGKRPIKDGRSYNRFFAKPKGRDITVKKEARLKDTLKWMKKVVAATLDQTEAVARHLQGEREKLTCKRIWNFCFSFFQYEKDELRKEQIRTPNRAWGDRKKGIDCDCFTVLICSILTHLGIPHLMRMTRYEEADFEHIYPVALTNEGEIIIDAVVHRFNYEVPYTEKEDIEMELQVLSGVKGERYNEFGEKVEFEHDLPIDAEDLFLDESEMELEGLEGKAEREARKRKRKEKRSKRKSERKARNEEIKKLPLKERVKARVAQGFHVINKLNPGAALLRGGILASMKLNLFKVASNLRFAYWNADEARKNNMDMAKYHQLQRIKQKIDKIYFGAGGRPEALKKSILTGRGNRNRMVGFNGLGALNANVSDEDDLRTILGDDLFFEELNGFEGLDGLGEPSSIATGAAVTAASGVLGTIAALIKKLGSLFKKGSKAAEKFKIQDNSDNAHEKKRKFNFKNVFNKIKTKIQERRERKAGGGEATPADNFSIRSPEDGGSGLEPMEPLPEDEFVLDNMDDTDSTDSESSNRSAEDEDTEEKSWFKKNWVWVVPTGLAVGTGAFFGIRHLVKKSKAKKSGSAKTSMAGVSKSKKGKKKKSATTSRKRTKATRSKTNKTSRRSGTGKKKTTRKKSKTGIDRFELM